MHQPEFLPFQGIEKERLGIRQFDIILVTGDAYVDHPSFGTALIGRVLSDAGFTVGILAQPDWTTSADFTVLGKPRLFFGISSGNVDSMVNNFTPNLKRRSHDVYSPGGIPKRPDRATIVYTNRFTNLFPDTPIVLGGIEASLRRFAHYDYSQDRVRHRCLLTFGGFACLWHGRETGGGGCPAAQPVKLLHHYGISGELRSGWKSQSGAINVLKG